ncbi:MAG TPA: hypothetical protein VGE67_01835 [Haloferula sp.]
MNKRQILIAGLILTVTVATIGWRKAFGPSSFSGGSSSLEAKATPPPDCESIRPARPFTAKKVNSAIHLLPETEEIASRLNAADATPKEDLETLDQLVTIFRRTNEGENPSGGENDEIVRQLTGKNDKSVAVLPSKHPALAGNGQLLDRWGTPYYFHPISRDVLGLRSAGPDRKLWTTDDVALEESDFGQTSR